MRHLPKQTHRVGEVLETYTNEKGKPYQKVIEYCSRCGGDGHYSYNQLDGTTCYGCSGSGVQVVERRVLSDKEKAQREKARKRKQDRIQAEREAREEKKAKALNKPIYIVCHPDTYSIKEELKEKGAKFERPWGWHFTEVVEGYQLIETTKATTDPKEIEQMVKQALGIKESEYQGEVGDKITVEAKLRNYAHFDTRFGTKWIYIFEDHNNNLYKWATTSSIPQAKGDWATITGTVKEHEEYNEEKQTVLQRVKIKEA